MTVDKYILDGHNAVPIHDLFEWGKWFETAERHVAQDEPIPDVLVSTVFLGLDQSFGDGPPLLFETMVFGGELDQEQDRYSTWDEAERGHAAMVERVKRSQPQTEGGASHESTPQVREKGAGERARELAAIIEEHMPLESAAGEPGDCGCSCTERFTTEYTWKGYCEHLAGKLVGALAAVRLEEHRLTCGRCAIQHELHPSLVCERGAALERAVEGK